MNEDYVMYILFNNELNMEIDKIICQCCHSVGKIIRTCENLQSKPENYLKWINNYETKIILKAKEEDLLYCISKYTNNNNNSIWCEFTLDLGKIEISPFSVTSVAFTPIKKSETPEFIKKLKNL